MAKAKAKKAGSAKTNKATVTTIDQAQWPVLPSRLDIADRCAGLETKVKEIEANAAQYAAIDSEEIAQEALEVIDFIKKSEQSIDVRRKKYLEPTKVFVSTLNEFVGGYVKRLNEARRLLSGKVFDYQKERQRRLQAEAEERRKAEEREAARRAKKLEKAGDADAAARLREIAATAPAPKTDVRLRSESGVSFTTSVYWVGELVDTKALLQAILDGKFPIEAIKVGQSYMNKFAGEHQDQAGKTIHGIKIVKDERVGTR